MKKFTARPKSKVTASQQSDEVQRGVKLMKMQYDMIIPEALEYGLKGLDSCIRHLRDIPDPYKVFPEPEFQGNPMLDDIDEEYQYYLAVADELEDVCNRIKELM